MNAPRLRRKRKEAIICIVPKFQVQKMPEAE
jgi:hypothetical protein